jgi:hypothetical protein
MYQSYLAASIREGTAQSRANLGDSYSAAGRQPTYLNPGTAANRNTISLVQNVNDVSYLVKNYRDSHVIMSDDQDGMTFRTVTVAAGPPNGNDPSGDNGDRPANFSAGNLGAADHTHVVYIPWLGAQANTFYYLHVLGRDDGDAHPANFMFNIPGVNLTRFVFRWDAGEHNGPADYAPPNDVGWTSPDTIWSYIIAYVKLNRVESTFAHVHEVMCRTCFYPEAASAEGWTYKKAGLDVYLPEPAYYRGKYEPLLKGEPYSSTAIGVELTFLDQLTAFKEVITGGLINYTSLLGLWATFYEYTLHYQDMNVAYTHCNADYTQLSEPHAQMAFAVGALTGRDPMTMFEPNIGVKFDIRTYMLGGLHSWVRESTTGADVTGFDIQDHRLNTVGSFHAPVSPSLLYGKVASVLTGTAHCTDGFKMADLNADTLFDYESALRIVNAYRLFGIDVTLKETTGEQNEFTPWSPAHTVGIQPNSIAHDARLNTQYIVIGSSQRERYNTRVSDVQDALHSGTIEFSVMVTSIKFKMALSARHAASTIYRKTRNLPRINIKVSAGGTVAAKLEPIERPRPEAPIAGEQDFGHAGQQQPEIPQQAIAGPGAEGQEIDA